MYRMIRTTLAAGAIVLGLAGAIQADPLNKNQIDAIMTALDDEFYAIAFYDEVMAAFGPEQPFASIAKTEHTHIGHLTALLRSADVVVPANPYETGEKPLVAVPTTLSEACHIAMADEVENAELFLSKLMPTATGNEALMAIFTELRDTSEQVHMPAFRRCSH
jgi:D-mannonate dehydratase